VIVSDPGTISVGFLAPDDPGLSFAQLYLSGSDGSDDVTVSYAQSSATVTFAASAFDTTQASTSGCGTYTATTVVCSLGKGLDAIVVAGMGGADTLVASGFPISSSVVVLGGRAATGSRAARLARTCWPTARMAKLSGTEIEARIAEATAGRPSAAGPTCDGAGEAVDILDAVDDLKGTSGCSAGRGRISCWGALGPTRSTVARGRTLS
jgi:hypothetical protein